MVRPRAPAVVQLVARRSPRRCAYCLAPVGVAARCADCGVAMHPACARVHGRCSTIGCQGAFVERARERPAGPAPPWVAAGVAALALGWLLGAGLARVDRGAPPPAAFAFDRARGETARALVLLDALDGPDPDRRGEASLTLGRLLVDEVYLAPGLCAAIGDRLARAAGHEPYPVARRSAEVALADAAIAGRLPRLPHDDPSPAVRAAALAALAWSPLPWHEGDVARLAAALERDPHPGVRARAAACLARGREQPGPRAALARSAREDEEPLVRDVAAIGLGEVGRDWARVAAIGLGEVGHDPVLLEGEDARRLHRLGPALAAEELVVREAATDTLLAAPAHTLAAFTGAVELAAVPETTRSLLILRLERLGHEPGLRSLLGGCVEHVAAPVAGLRRLADADPSDEVARCADEALERLHGACGTTLGAARQAALCVDLEWRLRGVVSREVTHSGGCCRVQRGEPQEGAVRRELERSRHIRAGCWSAFEEPVSLRFPGTRRWGRE